jgi:NitT/TauT family transport system substrate-binding protein
MTASTHTRWLLGLLLMLPLTFAWAAGQLTFAVARTPMSLPIYMAEAEGYFAAENVSVRIVDCAFGKACLGELLNGKAALCTVADLPIVLASFTTDRFAILATLAANRNDAKIIVRKADKIRSAADLSGRRVGTAMSTSAHYFLDSAALLAGIDPASMKVSNVQPEDWSTKLQANEVDAISAFEPYAFNAVRALGPDALILPTKRIYTLSWNIVATRGILDAEDHHLDGVLRALDRAVRSIQSDPARAKILLKSKLGLDDAAIEWIWPDLIFGLWLDQSLISTLEGEARWAVRGGYARGRQPNYLHFIHEGPLRVVKPGNAAIAR